MFRGALDISPIESVILHVPASYPRISDQAVWSVIRLNRFVERRRLNYNLLGHFDYRRQVHKEIIDTQKHITFLQHSRGLFYRAAWDHYDTGTFHRLQDLSVGVLFFRSAKEQHGDYQVDRQKVLNQLNVMTHGPP